MNLRPTTVRLVDCENVLIRDVHLLEAANMALHLLGCRNVNIDGIVIQENVMFNRDGLDIDCCQGVKLSNSQFSTGDDAIAMKSTSDVICQDIAISNCIINSKAACAI
jgi:polygalacturonase